MAPTPNLPFSGEVLIIDQAAVRQEAMQALEDARTELEDLKTQLATFQERDQPFFQSWVHRTFAAPLRDLQECVQQIYKKRLLIDSVLQEAILKGISYREAYENVQAGESGFKPEDPSEDSERQDQRESRATEEDEVAHELFEEDLKEQGIDPGKLDPVEYDAMLRAFKAENGFTRSESREDREAESAAPKRPVREPHVNELGQIKRLYRLLARRLHPDTGSEQSKESQTLWLEAQNAYEQRDLPRLEALWATLNEHDSEGFTSTISIADINETVKQILKAIGGLRKDLRKAHKDPAWGFSLPGARKGKKVHKKIKTEVEAELSEAQEALAALEALIDGWLTQGHFDRENDEKEAYEPPGARGRSRRR